MVSQIDKLAIISCQNFVLFSLLFRSDRFGKFVKLDSCWFVANLTGATMTSSDKSVSRYIIRKNKGDILPTIVSPFWSVPRIFEKKF